MFVAPPRGTESESAKKSRSENEYSPTEVHAHLIVFPPAKPEGTNTQRLRGVLPHARGSREIV